MDIIKTFVYISNMECMEIMERYYSPDIRILFCDYREKITAWKHENVFNSWWYFYWNSTPGAVIKEKNSKYQIAPDKFCLIAPETAFSTGLKTPFNHFYLHFTVGAPFDQLKSKIYFFPVDELVIKQVEMIKPLLSSRAMNSAQLSLLTHSVVCCLLLKINQNEFKRLKKYDRRIELALENLNRDTSSIVPNESLAENAGMSVNGFIRLFAGELGISPQKYSRRKRIEKASILLHFTDKKIDEIARETGFLDRYHFSKAFRETTNYSPAEFRKRRISF